MMLERQTIPIREVYAGMYDGPHATPKPSESGPIFLGIKNVGERGQLDLSDVRHISEEEYPRWIKRVEPKYGDIVFSYEATLNRYAMIPKGFRGCLGRRMALIRPDESKTSGKFLYYYFFGQEWRNVIAQNTLIGSTVDRIPIAKFPDFPITVPPLPTQRKIAATLSAYDDLIENNLRRIKILEEMAQTLYREWFVKFRFPGHQKSKMVNSTLGKIPEGWEIGKIDELVNICSGFAFKSNTFVNDAKYKVITIKNVKDGIFIDDSDSQIEEIPKNMPEHCFLYTGDILLSLTGNVGRACLVFGNNFLLNQRVAKLVPRTAVNRGFIYTMFRQADMQKKLEMISTGVAQQNLSPVQMGKMEIVIPPLSILDKFASFVEPICEQIISLYLRSRILRQTCDLLLSKLISGELDVSELDISIPEKTL